MSGNGVHQSWNGSPVGHSFIWRATMCGENSAEGVVKTCARDFNIGLSVLTSWHHDHCDFLPPFYFVAILSRCQKMHHCGVEMLFVLRCPQGVSFKSPAEERNWRGTTEVQMSMPSLGGKWQMEKNVQKSKKCQIVWLRNASAKENQQTLWNLRGAGLVSCGDSISCSWDFRVFAFENCQVLETPERYLIIMGKVEGAVGNGARVVAVQ